MDKFLTLVHTLEALVPPELYKTHPEYFPLVKGKRVGGFQQRCLSNPEVLKLTIAKVRQWIKERPNDKYFEVSQNDLWEFCHCDKCTAIANRYGGQSGLYLWFVNQVADAIGKDHPDKVIDTIAYQFTQATPKNIVPPQERLHPASSITCSDVRPYNESDDLKTQTFIDDLKGWSKISDELYIWHYCTGFFPLSHALSRFPRTGGQHPPLPAQ